MIRNLLAALLISLPFAPTEGRCADQPNIIVILVDDMGVSDIGCYGSEIPTPNLDALAAGGVKFSQFYNTGRCCPTRASLLTGLYPHQAGVGWMTDDQKAPGYRGQLGEDCRTIAEVLNPAGYFTAMTGKWHVGFKQGATPASRGFARSLNLPAGGVHFSNQTGSKGGSALYLNGEEVSKDDPRFDPPWYAADLWTRQGIRFLEEASEEKKPFFLYLAHTAPHFPCMAPEATIAKYRGKYLKGWDKLREERHQRQIELGFIEAGWPLTPRPEEIPAWDSLSEEEKVRYDDMMAIYAAMIDEIDKNVGVLVDALREREELDNTLILFLTDNGGNAESGVTGKYKGEHPGNPDSDVFIGQCWAHLNNTPFRLYKHYNHEGGIASPLIAHWPSVINPESGRNGWIDTPAHLIDLMATFVDIGGATYPKSVDDTAIQPMEGKSLRPLFEGGTLEERPLFFEHEGNAAIRTGNEKLVRQGRGGEWEYFDMSADRTEQHNLAATHSDRVEELREQWHAWAKRARVLPLPETGAKGKGKAKGQKGKKKKKDSPTAPLN